MASYRKWHRVGPEICHAGKYTSIKVEECKHIITRLHK